LRFLPVLAAIYVFAVIDVNGLISLHWRTLSQAQAALDRRGLFPFWHSYIVSKAHAFESQAAHVVMFLPIGMMLSLRRRGGSRDAWMAALLAFLFALVVEVGRWFRPDLQPDFYEAVTAAIAAGLAVKPMTRLWSILEDEMADRIKIDGPEKFHLGRAAPLPGRFSNGWTKVPIVLRSEQITFLERVPGYEEHSLSGVTRHVIGLFIKRLAGDEPDAPFLNNDPSALGIMGRRPEDKTGYARRERGHRQVVNLPNDYVEFLSGLSVKLGTTMSRTVQMILDDFITEMMKTEKNAP
jgi:VanZ family protein